MRLMGWWRANFVQNWIELKLPTTIWNFPRKLMRTIFRNGGSISLSKDSNADYIRSKMGESAL